MPTLKSPAWGLIALLVVGCATSSPRPGAGTAILGSSRTVIESIDEQNIREDGADPRRLSSRFRRAATPSRSAWIRLDGLAPSSRQREDHHGLFRRRRGSRLSDPTDLRSGSVAGQIVDALLASPCPGCAEIQETTTAAQAPATAASPSLEETHRPASLPVPSRPLVRDSQLPGSGLTAGVGFCFGGESLYTVSFLNAPDRNLNAGRGVLVTVGGLWTPLWIDDQFGFGAGASAGWKYDSIEASNGAVSLTRFPLTATAHSLSLAVGRASGYEHEFPLRRRALEHLVRATRLRQRQTLGHDRRILPPRATSSSSARKSSRYSLLVGDAQLLDPIGHHVAARREQAPDRDGRGPGVPLEHRRPVLRPVRDRGLATVQRRACRRAAARGRSAATPRPRWGRARCPRRRQ